MGREAADRDSRKGMAQRIEPTHAGEPIAERAGNREGEIDVPKGFRSLGNTRRQLGILDRTGCFSAVQLHAADAQHGQHGDGENDNAHAAEPLQLLAIIKNGYRQVVEPGKNRRPGGREPGHGFEDRICKRQRQTVRKVQWRRAKRAQHRPERGHYEEAIAQPQVFAGAVHRQPAQEAGGKRDTETFNEGQPGVIVVVQAEQDRRQHGDAEHHQQQSKDALYYRPVHASFPVVCNSASRRNIVTSVKGPYTKETPT